MRRRSRRSTKGLGRGAAEALADMSAAHERRWRDEYLGAARAELSQDEIDALLQAGGTLGRAQAIELAERVLASPTPGSV